MRLLRQLGLKAKLGQLDLKKLDRAALPAMGLASDGRAFILAQRKPGQTLILVPGETGPRLVDDIELAALWGGRVIMASTRAGQAGAGSSFGLSWFVPAIVKHRKLLLEVLAASLVLQLFGLATPLFSQVIIDKVLVHRGLATLYIMVIGMGMVALFEAALGWLRTWLFSHTTNRIDVILGAQLFRHLLALPLAYFGARRVGDSVARVRELETIRNFITGSGLTLILDGLFTVVFLAVMAVYSLPLTLLVAAAIPCFAAISLLLTPLLRRRVEEKFAKGAQNQALLVEAITGIETVKAMALEPQMQRRWEEQLAGYVGSAFQAANLSNGGGQAIQLIAKLVTVLVLYQGAELVIDSQLTIGQLVAFNMLSARVIQPVLRLAQMWQDFQQARVSLARLGDILNSPTEPSAGAAVALPALRGALRFEGVTFRYRPEAQPALRGVSLTVPAGQTLGIVGASGSGKSTLLRLVQRLYVAEAGRVFVDDIDIATINPAWLRRQIGVVLQDNVLFNRSVRDNIALADPSLPMEEVIAAAQLAGAHDFITQLPEGYDTPVGERGASLSGGQRQRIAIARALIGNPKVLIFDEATSALDYESEQAIQANMRQICAGRTVLIIAHRLAAVREAERIIVVDQGQIVEDGTPAALLAENGRFATLHRLQGGGPS